MPIDGGREADRAAVDRQVEREELDAGERHAAHDQRAAQGRDREQVQALPLRTLVRDGARGGDDAAHATSSSAGSARRASSSEGRRDSLPSSMAKPGGATGR